MGGSSYGIALAPAPIGLVILVTFYSFPPPPPTSDSRYNPMRRSLVERSDHDEHISGRPPPAPRRDAEGTRAAPDCRHHRGQGETGQPRSLGPGRFRPHYPPPQHRQR